MIKYYVILLISWLGLPIGWWLAKKAWDEVKEYKTILEFLRILTLVAIAFLIMAEPLLATLITLAWAVMYYQKLYKWIYSSLPIALWISHPFQFSPYIASLTLFYGLIEGSLQTRKLSIPKKFDAALKLMRDNFAFLVVGALLGLIL